MIKLLIPIEYYGLYHPIQGSPRKEVDYHGGTQVVDAILFLTTIPAITYNLKAGKTNLGRWFSTSSHFGKNCSGVFYVTRVESWDHPDYDPYGTDRRVKNPIGRFYDSDSVAAGDYSFLTLYKFAPSETPTESGFGMLGHRRARGVGSLANWSKIANE